MSDERLPFEMIRFIEQHIRSVGHLEVLLFMFTNRDREWCAEQISVELRSNVSYAKLQLEELTNSSLLEQTSEDGEHFCFKPKSADLCEQVGKLGELYRERRVSIINAIYDQPIDRIRSFADAFRIKKE